MIADARITRRNALLGTALLGTLLIGGAAAAGAAPVAPAGFADIPYADWSDDEPPYRLFPGDEVEVNIPSAPELSRSAIVQPDGRIGLALIGSVMVADRTLEEAQGALGQAYAQHLLRPAVTLSVKAAPLKVFVGGEVGTPGVIDMNGDADALRAIVQAGGLRPSADLRNVIVLRRGPDGRGMMRTVNLARGLHRGEVDLVPLRRFDIVYVPRSGAAAAGVFVQQYFRDIIPATLGFSYALGARSVR